MGFLLDTTFLGNINPMYIILAIGMALLVGFYVYKTKFENNNKPTEQNLVLVDTDMQTDENADCLDEEIVAVIAAAIAMAESESNGLKFKVVSFRRI